MGERSYEWKISPPRCGCRRGELYRMSGFEPGGAYAVWAENSQENLLALIIQVRGPDRVAKWEI